MLIQSAWLVYRLHEYLYDHSLMYSVFVYRAYAIHQLERYNNKESTKHVPAIPWDRITHVYKWGLCVLFESCIHSIWGESMLSSCGRPIEFAPKIVWFRDCLSFLDEMWQFRSYLDFRHVKLEYVYVHIASQLPFKSANDDVHSTSTQYIFASCSIMHVSQVIQ